MEHYKDVLISKKQFLEGTELKPLIGSPMKIFLRQDAVPAAIHTPRLLPLAWREKVMTILQAMVKQGIIVPVGDEPSEWCHPLVVVAKPHGDVRLTVDFTRLNRQVSRPTHPAPTPHAAVRRVPAGTRFFSTMDALCGYWQLPLAEEDQYLTTFVTPFGRFKYCRGPMGFVATGDEFCRRGDMALAEVQQCAKVIDDILMWDHDYESHLRRVHKALQCCRTHGLTMNADKFVLAASSVTFCGYRLSTDGVAADVEKVRAIKEFPVPKNITDLRSFLGLTNQLAEFSSSVATAYEDLRPLLRPSNKFVWSSAHTKAFQQVKDCLSTTPILAFFDPSRQTMLQTDASRLFGIGYALLQKDSSGIWRLIQCGSRFLADVETRYATIELELVAVVWAMRKCSYYLLGLPDFKLVTDHRPLVPILSSYTLDMIDNPRLQRLREKITGYTFTTEWRKGKDLAIPDALSRAPVDLPSSDDLVCVDEVSTSVRAVAATSSAWLSSASASASSDLWLTEMRSKAGQDEVYRRLCRLVCDGFPTSVEKLSQDLRPFWKIRHDLYQDDGLVLFGCRLIIPVMCRREILTRLHDSHRGVEATKRRARMAVWWPGIDADISSTVRACVPCQVLLPSLPMESLIQSTPSSRPFEATSADYFSVAGKQCLVYVDRYSGWAEVAFCNTSATSTYTTSCFSKWFQTFGAPISLRTDGGSQFASKEFMDFLKRWGVRHECSSPYNPRSNGHAEAAVKTIKHLILKVAPSGIHNEDFARSLLELRNTPSVQGLSPAQLLLGRSLRSCVPAHPSSLLPTPQSQVVDTCARKEARQAQVARAHDNNAVDLSPLITGTMVLLQNPTTRRWDTRATVHEVLSSRSYMVHCHVSGAFLERNRRYLRVDHAYMRMLPPPPGQVPALSPRAPRRSPRLHTP